MSIKEMNQIKRKDIKYQTRLKMATAIRDFTDSAKSATRTQHSVEAFNDKNLFKDPDTVGITMYYPNMVTPTHIATMTFDLKVGERAFGRQVKMMEQELLIKAGV